MTDASAAVWRKSSYSNAQGGECVEVADGFPGIVPVRDSKRSGGPVLVFGAEAWRSFISAAVWHKSSYSNSQGGDCVEVADGFPGLVPVRDSKRPEGPVLVFGATAWQAFVAQLAE
ncbi:DUF397 domain-containing protein [Streptomyces niger]|uniref:DUF397 domain-containing protein n=1 Tax=Streptomyces niger TaxID=66373 RepID=UPI000699E868|nr:DUF397 domain-containing protein [Streptomyces niger]